MQNSIAAGRRLAIRVVGAQLIVTMLVAAGFLLQGAQSSLGVLSGGFTVALATGILVLRVFAAAPASAGVVFGRFIVGNLLKWGVIALGLYVAMVKAGLPGFAVMIGVIAALLPQLLGLHDGWMR
ncbi:MAG: ATP synthase subunit I [Rudaea sp.]